MGIIADNGMSEFRGHDRLWYIELWKKVVNGDTKLMDDAQGMTPERRKDVYERYQGHYVLRDFFCVLEYCVAIN